MYLLDAADRNLPIIPIKSLALLRGSTFSRSRRWWADGRSRRFNGELLVGAEDWWADGRSVLERDDLSLRTLVLFL